MNVTLALFDRGAVTVETHTLPARGPGEIDVAISCAAICGSDLHTVLGHRTAPERTVLGHEGTGRVIGVDSGATDLRGDPLRAGDRVVFGLFDACGKCDRCAGGLEMKCRSLVKYGHESVETPPHATGTLASHIRLGPGVPVLRVTDGADDALVVSAGCAVATAAEIIAAGPAPGPGTRALVIGAGAVGAYCAAMLISLGADVWMRERSEARLAAVERFGARRDDGRTDAPFPLVIEASGNAEAFASGVEAVALGGHLIAAGSVSPGGPPLSIDPAMIVTRRITIAGVHNYTAASFLRGVDWLLAHGAEFGVDRLVSQPWKLSEIREAFAQMEKADHLRVLVQPDPC